MFDTNRLKGRIVERFGTLNSFAEAAGVNPGTLTSRLKGRSYWDQKEIMKIASLLEISDGELVGYFFTPCS